MANKTIITQAEIGRFRDILSLTAANLSAHANHSLSKAHGVEVATGYVDGYGNDLTTYRNSRGVIVGTKMIRLAVNGVLYYAPAVPTSLAGQPAATGIPTDNPDDISTTVSPNPASLVTEYGSIEVAQAEAVNNLLLEHTRLNHDVVHSENQQMRVVQKSTFDATGALIGRFVAKLVIAGVEYELPCDTRLGGPPQPPQIRIFPASKEVGDIDPPYGITSIPIIDGGTRPITFSYQYFNNGPWANLPLGVTTYIPFIGKATNSVLTTFVNSSTGEIRFDQGAPGGNSLAFVRVWATATNDAGTTSTDVNGNPLYFDFYVQDHASSFF